MMNPPTDIIEFHIAGYLDLLRDPDLSERMRERLIEKLADTQQVLRFAAEEKVHVLTQDQRRGHLRSALRG